MITGVALVTRA